MKEKVIHVVHGATTKYMLNTALRDMGIDDNVVYFPLELSVGYIPQNVTIKEMYLSLLSRYLILQKK